jgi:hypothetical protein
MEVDMKRLFLAVESFCATSHSEGISGSNVVRPSAVQGW